MWKKEFDISFNLIPKPKGRPRFSKKGFAYTPSSTKKAERDMAVLISDQLKGKMPIDTAIRLEMDVYMPRPKSHYGSGKNSDNIKDSSPKFPITKPDIDNLEKAFCDAAEGLLWTNDSRIVQKTTNLWYADDRAPGYDIFVYKYKESE